MRPRTMYRLTPPAAALLPAPTTQTPTHARQNPLMLPVHSQEAVPPSPWVVSTNGQILTVNAQLDNVRAVDRLIRVLEANKLLLPEEPNDQQASQSSGDADAHEETKEEALPQSRWLMAGFFHLGRASVATCDAPTIEGDTPPAALERELSQSAERVIFDFLRRSGKAELDEKMKQLES